MILVDCTPPLPPGSDLVAFQFTTIEALAPLQSGWMIFSLPEGKACAAFFADNNHLPEWTHPFLTTKATPLIPKATP